MFTSIGICGSGKMAISFYKYMLRFNDYHIVLYARDINKTAKLKGKKDRTPISVQFTDKIEDLGDCDIVFEFVTEDIVVKREVVRKLKEIRRNPQQVVATGSSSFVPSRITEEYNDYRMIGVHFIYPIQIINTVEVVFGEKTPAGLVRQVSAFLRDIGKIPVSMDERIGCITTRVLAVLGNEAFRLHKQYQIPMKALDDIIDKSAYTPAPFDLQDTVGLDTIYNCISGHYQGRPGYGSFALVSEFLKEKMVQGHLGKKTGHGFYRYRGEDETGNDKDYAIRQSIQSDILERIKTLYINTSFELVEKCYADCKELDRIFYEINGTEKGPAYTLFQAGAGAIVEKLKDYAQAYGVLYTPLRILQYIAKNGKGREDIDQQIRDFHLGGKKPDWCSEDILR